MPLRPILWALVGILSTAAASSWAALIVDPALPLTHRVSVQIIETAPTGATPPATIFGDPMQSASIEAGIDRIWAQAGIDIEFLPSIAHYNNTFAYQGNGGARPTSDLNQMLSAARSAGVLNTDPTILNMFFVNIVPGFAFTSESHANGLANIGASGVAQFVGDNLLTFQNGRDVISQVVAHEIGHNMGLKHAAHGGANLMSPDGTTEQLSATQIAAIFQTTRRSDSIAFIPTGGIPFLQLVPPVVAGDYNGDGQIAAADYTVWRDTFGSRTDLAADGNHNLVVDSGDYTAWKNNFTALTAAGETSSQAVPEPAAMIAVGIFTLFAIRLRVAPLPLG